MPLQDPAAAVAEAERAAKLGYKAVMVNPNRINGRRLDSPDYERFYAAVAASGLRLCEQCYISFDPEDHEVPHVAEVVGDDRLFYASDYPHYDAAFPNSARVVLDRTDLTEAQKKAFLCDNPARFHGLEARVDARKAGAPA